MLSFSLPAPVLAEALGRVARALATRDAVPQLTHVLFEAGADLLRITASDLELGLEVTIAAAVAEPGAVLVPGRAVHDLVRRLPPDPVTVTGDERGVTVACRRARYELPGLAAADYPSVPWDQAEGEELRLPLAAVRELLDKVAYAVGHDDTRPTLTGVYFAATDSGLEACATDNFRLAWARRAVPVEGPAIEAIVPPRALGEVLRLVQGREDVRAVFGPRHAFFLAPDLRAFVRLIGGQYPDYRRFLPQEFKTRVHLATRELEAAVQRAALVAEGERAAVRFQVQGDLLVLTAGTPDAGLAHEEVACACEGEGQEIAFDARYVLDALRTIPEEGCALDLVDAQHPARLAPEGSADQLAILVPLLTH